MDRLDEIRAFTAVAEARSFTQGARKLDVSPAQISKLVARLENRLDARLLNRTTRDVSLTDTGQAYLERARELLEGFDALETSVRDQGGPSGTLKVSAPVSFGKDVVAEPLPADLEGFSVLLYSGNFGVAHDVETVAEGYRLHHRAGTGRVRLWLSATGAGADDLVRRFTEQGLPFHKSEPVPLERLAGLLRAPHAHLVQSNKITQSKKG